MTAVEHLLACIAEEAGEIVQACGKALRFGVEDGYPGTDRTNAADLAIEIYQLNAVFAMLKEHGLCLGPQSSEVESKKRAKVLEFMEYAVQKGALEAHAQATEGRG